MARSTPTRGFNGFIWTAITVAGLLFLYIGERVVGEGSVGRTVLGMLGIVGILVAVIARFTRASRLGALAKPVELRLAWCGIGAAIAVLIYFAQSDLMDSWIRHTFANVESAERYRSILSVLWPIVLMVSMVPALFIESSYAAMDPSATVEAHRIRRSTASGLVAALTIAIVFVLNYVANQTNEKTDLSYFKTTRPSETTRKMIQQLSEPMRIVLFFPTPNEVLDHVRAYLDDITNESKHVQVEVVDHLLNPKLAQELGATANGTIVFVRGEKKEKFQLNTNFKYAKGRLRKFDAEFQSYFLKAMRDPKVAYLTTGHEERGVQNRGEPPEPGSGITTLRRQLVLMNYSVKDLNANQLGWEVPQDASVVIIVSPLKELFSGEIESLKRYLDRGGRMMIFLDAEADVKLEGLLSPYGIRFVPETLVSPTQYARVTYTPTDKENIFTNSYSSHPSVNTLVQNANKVATVFMRAGYVEKIPLAGPALAPNITFTMHTPQLVWNDVNRNWEFDDGPEKRATYELSAAITAKANSKDAPAKADAEARLIVAADSNMVSDKIFANAGNGYFFVDGIKWLVGDEDLIGESSSEEDVKIQHTRNEDQLWFYLTIFGMPVLVVVLGILYTRLYRRRRRSA